MTTCPRCQRTYDDAVRFCPVDGALVMPSADASIALNTGRVLMGQFELRELAGRGATGTVWRAYQRSMDRIVAVKILHRDLARDLDVVRRFLREARAVAKITHPNIVTVHIVGETEEGTPYLVMEHVDGISLETIVEAQGAQPVARVVHLAKQIAAGLGEAHANNIVHRDLKPANVLVTDRARVADQVKILDFGIAKLIHPGQDQSLVTRGQQIFGTPHYMAPEQATGDKIDLRTDLYALGCVMFRLVTGQVPFDAPAGMQVVLRQIRDEPPRPSTLNPTIPPPLEDLILACLQKSPEDRPKDTDDVVAALEEIGERSTTKERKVPPPLAATTGAATPPPPPQPKGKKQAGAPTSPAVTGQYSGSFGRPQERRDRSSIVVVLLLAVVGLVLYIVTHLGGTATATNDLAIAQAVPDLAILIPAAGPDRIPEDLAIAEPTPDLSAPVAKKKRRHDDDSDLPVTVFGAEPTTPAPPAPPPAPPPSP